VNITFQKREREHSEERRIYCYYFIFIEDFIISAEKKTSGTGHPAAILDLGNILLPYWSGWPGRNIEMKESFGIRLILFNTIQAIT
jgi:hypothetical protein